jgi:hypothetical protein
VVKVIQIQCTAPIPMADVKRKFTEEVEFVIDTVNSKFKGKTLLTYITNLEINARLNLTDKAVALDLVLAYMKATVCMFRPELEDIVIQMLLSLQGKENSCTLSNEELHAFADENRAIFETWMRRLNAVPLYAEYCLADREDKLEEVPDSDGEMDIVTRLDRHRADYVKSFPVDEDGSLVGINYANLIQHPLFVLYLMGVGPEHYTYNEKLFNERRIFTGKNLFYYFAHVNNPVFIVMLASRSEEDMAELQSIMQAEAEVTAALVKEYPDVSLT